MRYLFAISALFAFTLFALAENPAQVRARAALALASQPCNCALTGVCTCGENCECNSAVAVPAETEAPPLANLVRAATIANGTWAHGDFTYLNGKWWQGAQAYDRQLSEDKEYWHYIPVGYQGPLPGSAAMYGYQGAGACANGSCGQQGVGAFYGQSAGACANGSCGSSQQGYAGFVGNQYVGGASGSSCADGSCGGGGGSGGRVGILRRRR